MYNRIARNPVVHDKVLMNLVKICESFCFRIETDNGSSEIVKPTWGIPEGNVLSSLLWDITKDDFDIGVLEMTRELHQNYMVPTPVLACLLTTNKSPD